MMRLWVFTLWLAAAATGLGHGDLHERIVEVSAAIAKSPQNPQLYLQRAALHAAHHDLQAAAADYTHAESLGADPVAVWLGRGKVQLAAGRAADANASLTRVVARAPRHVDARVARARARVKLGDIDGAVADFTVAIEACTRPDPEFFLERAAVQSSAVPPRLDEAIRGLDEGLDRLGPATVTLQLAAIEIEAKAGRLDAALARVDGVAATAPRKEAWLVRRGDLLARAGRASAAADAYEAALAAAAKLPARARATQVIRDLEKHARQALTRVTAATPQ